MARILVVGSGPSAVHFSLSALERKHEVVMLDIGRERPAPVLKDHSFQALKEHLSDPVAYFLGERYEAVLFPGSSDEYYGFPPTKGYVFRGVPEHRYRATGFEPLASFAQGGLAEAWTGGAFPFNGAELADFPLDFGEIAPFYELVAARIGVSGQGDDLSRFVPVHEHLQEPLELDEHSRVLLEQYERHKARLNADLGCYVGRTRSATLSRDHDGRSACSYLGRCLWGCPTDSLYTPVITLKRLLEFPSFRYLPGRFVTHFEFDGTRRITKAVAMTSGAAVREEHSADALVLAAGTLSSSRIFLESIYRATGDVLRLSGLMDNRQALMPFVNLRMLRKPSDPESFQYHQLALGLEDDDPKQYVHGLITTLKTSLIHPIVQNVPLDLASALFIFRNVHAALGLVNVNLHDSRREDNFVTIDPSGDPSGGDGPARLDIHYRPAADERERLRRTLQRVRKVLRVLGCVVPPGMTHVRPMGASVHYAGAIPMTAEGGTLTCTKECRSRDFANLYFVDGTTFPFLPAKNVTFTLMANAARVAEVAF